MTKEIKKERSSNLELYRIILMLAIVAHHYVVNSGLIPILASEPLTLKSSFFYLFGMWGKTGINCFVLITGYFMCKSDITLKKFLRLLLQVLFYQIGIFCAFWLSGYTHPNVIDLLNALNPIGSVKDGFVSCFLIFYLCIPFLNILVCNMTKRQHQLLLLLSLGVYTVIANALGGKFNYNYVSWFCVLYFISSYIRLYGIPVDRQKIKWGGQFLLFSVLSMAIVLMLRYITKGTYSYILIGDPNFVLPTLTSVTAFMWFKDLKVRQSKLVNTVAQSVFGVLLIHAGGETMRHWLWTDMVRVKEQYMQSNAVLLAVLSVVVIFTVCVVIDQLRIRFVEKPLFGWMDRKYHI